MGMWMIAGRLACEQSVLKPQLSTYNVPMNNNRKIDKPIMVYIMQEEKSRFMTHSPGYSWL
jgi:hypothetical protein